MPFKPGNKLACNPKNKGRPRKLSRTIAELFSEEEITTLLRETYKRALRGEPTALSWFLGQLPRHNSEPKLPDDMPRMDSLNGCMAAIDAVSEMWRNGRLGITEMERAVSAITALAAARSSVLARFSDRIDEETRAFIEQEQKLRSQPPPAWPPPHKEMN